MTHTPAPAPAAPLYLDCDTGVDDSLALGYLLASPEIDLVGVGSVSGNVGARQGAVNTLDLLALAGRDDVPVAVGAHDPVAGGYDGGVPHIHGRNGVGDVILPPSGRAPEDGSAVELLLRLSHEHAGRLRVVAVGPLTNLALALRADPTLPERVRDLTVMGGAALHPGNVSPVGEANIANDPEAAATVLEADWDVTLVPLDVTMANLLEETDRKALLEAGTALAPWLGEVLDLYFGFHVPTFGRRCSALHDPLAAAIAVGGVTPTVAPRVPVVVDVTDGPGRGQTLCDLRGRYAGYPDVPGARTRVVLATDAPLAPHLVERLRTL
ncbi:nucleoside hydrolase [Krasilnikoviella flava]|uniref:Purine nucleosidase n=1 Tax=Krasilnikoviella flava TaxID=526729 RepID=A0A1T5KY98_9MICO|nr:nucleoside hydrolase [Krasilnikoviella flava]SKC68704.1 purine nucleosidase [Krasilnikoviella flava]